MSKKIAGIVIYKPDWERLHLNISKISAQVDLVLLYNNGEMDDNKLVQINQDYKNIKILGNGNNLGVATALNKLTEYAYKNGAEWILTLDQDSVCEDNLIAVYEQCLNEKDIGLISCTITDRNFEYEKDKSFFDVRYIDNCITSGSYIRIEAWKKIGGFDEKLFIDHVDTDFCYRLRISGWKILQTAYKGLLHEVGSNANRKKLFGKEFVVFNHSPFRCYYIIRNQIYFARKHRSTLGLKRSLRLQRTAWTRILVYLLYEDDKGEKVVSWKNGLRDGYKMHIFGEEASEN